jgi:hypothetical protein
MGMRSLPIASRRGVSNVLVISAICGISSLGVGCKLFKPDGAASDEYSGEYVPLLDETEGDPQFENATDAIMASRSTPASPEVAALEESFKAGDYEGALDAAREIAATAD